MLHGVEVELKTRILLMPIPASLQAVSMPKVDEPHELHILEVLADIPYCCH